MWKLFKNDDGRTVSETPLSHFVRNASSGEKKKVYSEVLRRATESQVRVIEQAEREQRAAAGADQDSKRR